MLKRKYSNKPDYKHSVTFLAQTEYVKQDDFHGYVTLFRFDEVEKPLMATYKEDHYCLADKGYIWLQTLPINEHYCLTTLIDHNHKIIEWYFDVIKDQGVKDGIPYFDDIYLDVVASTKYNPILLDEDELEEALKNHVITNEDYNKAYEVAQNIIENLTNTEQLTHFSNKYLHFMLDKLK